MLSDQSSLSVYLLQPKAYCCVDFRAGKQWRLVSASFEEAYGVRSERELSLVPTTTSPLFYYPLFTIIVNTIVILYFTNYVFNMEYLLPSIPYVVGLDKCSGAGAMVLVQRLR